MQVGCWFPYEVGLAVKEVALLLVHALVVVGLQLSVPFFCIVHCWVGGQFVVHRGGLFGGV